MLDTRVSIGLVPIVAASATATQLMSAAENACHVALELGGGQVHVADPKDHDLTARINQAQLVTQIKDALRENRFRLFTQRIAPVAEPDGVGHYELLIRMLDEAGRVIFPGAFLDIAEQYHLSILIDRWVISKAVECFSRQPDTLERLGFCSINLSGHSIGHPDILEHIRNTFTNGKIKPEKICFEITETAAIARMKYAVQFIRQLREMGFRFALDDFGSGLSSFGYLKNLPVDYIKIDGCFIRDLVKNPVDQKMVRLIGEIGREAGMRTIAEYVKDGPALALLGELGIDFAQGYYIGRPEAKPTKKAIPIPLSAKKRKRSKQAGA